MPEDEGHEDLGEERWYRCLGLHLQAVRPMTADEAQCVERLKRQWICAVGAAFPLLLASMMLPLTPHAKLINVGRAILFLGSFFTLMYGLRPAWRLFQTARRKQVWRFEGILSDRPDGPLAALLGRSERGSPRTMEVWAPGGFPALDGTPIPQSRWLPFVPAAVRVARVAPGDTGFVGERPMTDGERRELARDLGGFVLNLLWRPFICLLLLITISPLLDRLAPDAESAAVWAIKGSLVLWAAFWLKDLWRTLLVAADLLRGKCRRRPGWDLVTLPWSKTAWSKEDRPADWRLDVRWERGVPPKARTVLLD